MRDWPTFTDEIELNWGDPCPAEFQLTVDTINGRYEDVCCAIVERWWFNGREQARDTLIQLLGTDEVLRQEKAYENRWWEIYAHTRVGSGLVAAE